MNNQYVDPLYGIENLMQDDNGYVYWRGILIDHHSFRDNYEAAKAAANELAIICQQLEKEGLEVSGSNYLARAIG